MKCEIAKKLLDSKDSIVINENNIYNNEDLFFKISREDFDRICNDLFKEIEYKLNKILKISNVSPDNVNEILLIGGASNIPKVKQIVKNKFKNSTIIDSLDKDKIVACGAILYSCEKKKSITLNETIPYSLGISIGNNDPISYINHGDKMYKIIKQNSKIPITVSREFRIKIGNKKTLKLSIYEGNNKYVKYNKKIGELNINLEKAQVDSEINFTILFNLDIDNNLNVKVEIPSLKITKEEVIGKFGDKVKTKDGFEGSVLSINALKQLVRIAVELEDGNKEVREYEPRDLRFKKRAQVVADELVDKELKALEELEKTDKSNY
jgi:molecular chaperone DnaK (HSP70)